MVGLIKWVVILSAIGYGVKYHVLADKSDRDMVVDYAVRYVNDMKGEMIDRETLIKGARKTRGGLAIDYQLIDQQTLQYGVEHFKQEITENAIRNNCHKQEITSVLKLGVDVTYVYYDAFGKRIADTVLNKDNCG
jgi:hypothetical protein